MKTSRKLNLAYALLCSDVGYAELDDPVADLLCLYRALSDELCGQKGEGIPGFLVALRSEPELAQVFRQEVLGPLRDRARASLRRIVGPDCPQLDLLVDLAPSLLTYRRIMLGEDIDTDAFLSGILSLVTSCALAIDRPGGRLAAALAPAGRQGGPGNGQLPALVACRFMAHDGLEQEGANDDGSGPRRCDRGLPGRGMVGHRHPRRPCRPPCRRAGRRASPTRPAPRR